jgi:hypothetical protein
MCLSELVPTLSDTARFPTNWMRGGSCLVRDDGCRFDGGVDMYGLLGHFRCYCSLSLSAS